MKVENDKFYTKKHIAQMCIRMMNLEKYDLIIEPSAGDGAFSKQIPGCWAFDLVPEDESIWTLDFFDFDPVMLEEVV